VTINWTTTSEELLEADGLALDMFSAPTPAIVINELRRKISIYQQAYDENGIAAEDYEDYGPVHLFRTVFEKGWKDALMLVTDCRAKCT